METVYVYTFCIVIIRILSESENVLKQRFKTSVSEFFNRYEQVI